MEVQPNFSLSLFPRSPRRLWLRLFSSNQTIVRVRDEMEVMKWRFDPQNPNGFGVDLSLEIALREHAAMLPAQARRMIAGGFTTAAVRWKSFSRGKPISEAIGKVECEAAWLCVRDGMLTKLENWVGHHRLVAAQASELLTVRTCLEELQGRVLADLQYLSVASRHMLCAVQCKSRVLLHDHLRAVSSLSKTQRSNLIDAALNRLGERMDHLYANGSVADLEQVLWILFMVLKDEVMTGIENHYARLPSLEPRAQRRRRSAARRVIKRPHQGRMIYHCEPTGCVLAIALIAGRRPGAALDHLRLH